MRHLVGPRRDRRVPDAIELALVAERLARPRPPDDIERLAEAGLALVVAHPVGVVGAHDAAAADAELEAPLADVVDGGDLLGDAQRMVQRQHLDRGADPEAARAGRDGARDLERGGDDRAGGREVDLAEPDAVDPPRLRAVRRLEDVPERPGLGGPVAQLLDEDPDVHGVILARRAGRRQAAPIENCAPGVSAR